MWLRVHGKGFARTCTRRWRITATKSLSNASAGSSTQTLMVGAWPSTPDDENIARHCVAVPPPPYDAGRRRPRRSGTPHVQGEVATGPQTGAARRAILPRTLHRAPSAIETHPRVVEICSSQVRVLSRQKTVRNSTSSIATTPSTSSPRMTTVKLSGVPDYYRRFARIFWQMSFLNCSTVSIRLVHRMCGNSRDSVLLILRDRFMPCGISSPREQRCGCWKNRLIALQRLVRRD